jgi:hypothetical protein
MDFVGTVFIFFYVKPSNATPLSIIISLYMVCFLLMFSLTSIKLQGIVNNEFETVGGSGIGLILGSVLGFFWMD